MTNIDRAAEIIERATRGAHTTDGHPMKMSDHTAQVIAEALADAGLLAPNGMAYEYGDNGWDDETNSPMHYPVEPSCRDDDHYCPEPAPPRYRRLVGPWEEA